MRQGEDLEPLPVDDPVEGGGSENDAADRHARGRRRHSPHGRRPVRTAMVLVLAATSGALGVAMGLEIRDDETAGVRRRADAVQARLASEIKARETAETKARQGADAQAREHRRDEALAELFADPPTLRPPLVAIPDGTRACSAADIEFAGGSADFLRLFNRGGRPCAILDHPALLGRTGGGPWRPVPYLPATTSSYSDGPEWTGVFNPNLVAVLAIMTVQLDPRVGVCTTGTTATAHLDDLAIVVNGRPVILDGVSLQVGPCRPTMALFAFDSNDR